MPPALSAADLRFFEEHGYVVVRRAVSRSQASRTAAEAWQVSGRDAHDPSTWYSSTSSSSGQDLPSLDGLGALESGRAAMVEPWYNRTAPRVHEAFSQLWGSERLWCSHDVVGIRPPVRADNAIQRSPQSWEESAVTALHWDREDLYNYKKAPDVRSVRDGVGPLRFGVQGLLYLTDTLPENGALCLVPGFHRQMDTWLESMPHDSTPMEQLLQLAQQRSGCRMRRVGGEAGDLVIWSDTLPHGSTINTGNAPRIVQYLPRSRILTQHSVL